MSTEQNPNLGKWQPPPSSTTPLAKADHMRDMPRNSPFAPNLSNGGDSSGNARGTALIICLLMIDSLHYVFARLVFPYIEPALGAFYIIAVALVEVGLIGLITRRLSLDPLRRMWPTFLAIGMCVAVSTRLNYEAMAFIDPGVAAMVGKMTVLFSLGFGLLWLGERFTLMQGVGSAIAVVGLAVISFQPGDYLGIGAMMILFSTFIYALHAALTKRNMGEVDLLNFFFYRLLLTAAFLALFNLARGNFALPSAQAFPILLLVGTVDVVVSRFLYYWTLRKLDMSIFAIALAASPVAAVLWSQLLFDVFPTPQQLLGGFAILCGVAVVTSAPVLERRIRRRAEAADAPS
ncbi:MAG: DMT family transporter [Caldilineaceae bacterium SB0668_bin_21]|nr:DMT family transporter [Caldilineaceae bacterium SB0668_bin_21]MYC20919.1 DMT family transporter [Caldilineaceae bacterium SB0662_bin_25]